MILLHTADWHLCDRLGRLDRTDDLSQRVERMAQLCLDHDIEVLVIAGDLFSEQASVDQMTDSLNHIRQIYEPFFRKGGTILAITGNHDRDGKINMVRAGMTLASPTAGHDGVLPGGRMYLVNGRAIAKLRDRTGQQVQFVLTPYPFSSRYDLSATEYRSREEENKLLHAKVIDWLQTKSEKLDTSLPTVLVAHLNVRGSNVHALYKMTERDDVLFSLAELNPMWSYLALGHIHQPQELGGATHIQYSGSLDRLDFGETHDTHGATLVEINGSQPVKTTRLHIPPTPFYTIEINDTALELPELASRYPDADTAIVRFVVAPPTGGMSRDEVARRLKKQFPRWHEIKWSDVGATAITAPARFDPNQGFQARVTEYLEAELASHPHRDELLKLAQSLVDEVRSA